MWPLKVWLPLLVCGGGAVWTYIGLTAEHRAIAWDSRRGCISHVKADSKGYTPPISTCDKEL